MRDTPARLCIARFVALSGLFLFCWLALAGGGCESTGPANADKHSGASTREARQTFSIERLDPSDLRLVTYNVYFDYIFPDVNAEQAEKFIRVVRALDPDILNLQEIKRGGQAVADLLNERLPLPEGAWHAFGGRQNVIVSKYPITMGTDHTIPAGQRKLAMALVDLPDDRFGVDFYVSNNHHKCCGGTDNDPERQQQSDAVMCWIRDARTPGGNIDLRPGTPFAIVGDLNIVGSMEPVETLVTGDIANNGTYGPDFAPDWDGTPLTDAHPLHNGVGPADYTWRNDLDEWAPGRLDYIIYSDSVLQAVQKFILNTTTLPQEVLQASGLEQMDITLDQEGKHFDHLPLVIDFHVRELPD